ncbi:VOC family protein [Nitrogeniibacter mangrovi]|uniref:VOC family protein n=1 Tax=Nitrogeniibacter mangrovi TaxID=2016596 RepID=A0A6C1AZL7_9RHOO|nr:VOC family protein [Nitrogeniibacter mangrovi]QID16573.1 VOC family protein [Nitrogeniibacter mangrovi]
MNTHEKINYLELPACDLEATKAFFSTVFGWSFTDYGPEYTAFDHAGIDGGFYLSDKRARTAEGSVLIVLYSKHLAQTQAKVEAAGGTLIRPVFDFPGGRRFHFTDPSGNELAVWSDVD